MKHSIDMKRARISGQHLFAQNDPAIDTRLHRAAMREPGWTNEGRDSPECTEATREFWDTPLGFFIQHLIAALVIVLVTYGGEFR